MSDPNEYPPQPPGGGYQPPPPPPPAGGAPPPPPAPPGGGYPPQPPPAPGYPQQDAGYPPQPPPAPGYPPQPPPAPGYPPQAGGYQAYNPGAPGAQRFIPELGLAQGEPWQRLVARIIDGIILAIPGFILAASLLTRTINDCAFNNDCTVGAGSYVLYGVISIAISAAYYILFTTYVGSTPGKLVFGLKVVKQDGSPVDLQAATMRWILDLAPLVFVLLPFSGGRVVYDIALLVISIYQVVLLFSDPKQQDLYDKIGHTYVVKK